MKDRMLMVILTIISCIFVSETSIYADTYGEKLISENRTVSTEDDWNKYSNSYYYKQLSENEKLFYEDLKSECNSFLLTTKDFTYNAILDSYCTDSVIARNMDLTQVNNVTQLFFMENPQYYFLANRSAHAKTNLGNYSILLIVYTEFANGEERAKVTNNLNKFLMSWQKKIDLCKMNKDKVKKIHNLIIKRSEYNYGLLSAKDAFNEDEQYSQSIYSVIHLKKSVCVGYSYLFNMLCNSSGINSVVVTSNSHAWNKVKIGKNWYNIDCTWDDVEACDHRYDYFLKSDKQLSKIDKTNKHTICTWMKDLVPQ